MSSVEHPEGIPFMLFANQRGEVFEHPELLMVGRSGSMLRPPEPEELIPLPDGSELFVLPDRFPVGLDPSSGQIVVFNEPGVRAVAAFVAPAHTVTLNAAFQRSSASVDTLPLFSYSATGWYRGRFWVAAFRSDPDIRQDIGCFNNTIVSRRTVKALKSNRKNRLLQQLGKCCLQYGCAAAKNLFLGRWEAPLPTSPVCNASCAGCISLQPSGCCPASQPRIEFVPTVKEICEVAVPHLKNAERAIVSFGQGCEGEPLLQVETIARAVHEMRKHTPRGTIHLNTNGSRPEAMLRIAKAGVDSVRISLNSADRDRYTRYYRPRGYTFEDVLESIRAMKKEGVFVSLNYFVFPGITDSVDETEAFFELLDRFNPDMIQLRNLNIDPDVYLDLLGTDRTAHPAGIMNWYRMLKKEFPHIKTGYFNPSLK